MMIFLVLAIVFVGLAIAFINLNVSGTPKFDNKLAQPALIFLVLAIYTVVNSIICIYTNMTYGSAKFEKQLWLWALLHTILGCIPVGIMLIKRVIENIKQARIDRQNYKKLLEEQSIDSKQKEGYIPEEKAIIRLVKPNKNKKEYQVSGLDDVASKNN